MTNEGSRNASTNKELKKAREAYETSVFAKEKRKIEEIEVEVVNTQVVPSDSQGNTAGVTTNQALDYRS